MNFCPNHFQGISFFSSVMTRRPDSFANICGSDDFPDIRGQVRLFQTRYGVLLVTEVFGLPREYVECSESIFAYHIHEGDDCSGNMSDPFADAMAHYNPDNCEHPAHTGDLPPLFGNDGYAFSAFLTDKFCACEVIGRTIIIHRNPDDFTTQPSGNSGAKIACGVIQKA